jgi:hypothetical protein
MMDLEPQKQQSNPLILKEKKSKLKVRGQFKVNNKNRI